MALAAVSRELFRCAVSRRGGGDEGAHQALPGRSLALGDRAQYVGQAGNAMSSRSPSPRTAAIAFRLPGRRREHGGLREIGTFI